MGRTNLKQLKEVLLHELPANAYVEITDAGWRVGFTYIDHEDLFIHSLSDRILEKEVEEIVTKIHKDFTRRIFEVKIK